MQLPAIAMSHCDAKGAARDGVEGTRRFSSFGHYPTAYTELKFTRELPGTTNTTTSHTHKYYCKTLNPSSRPQTKFQQESWRTSFLNIHSRQPSRPVAPHSPLPLSPVPNPTFPSTPIHTLPFSHSQTNDPPAPKKTQLSKQKPTSPNPKTPP